MATPDVINNKKDLLLCASIGDAVKGESGKYVGSLIEKKIEFLESLTSTVSKRRTRRYLNDRLLIELVPRLNAEEIRGLFSPPPFGNDVQVSPFCSTKVGVWDKFGNTDMDVEDSILEGLDNTSRKKLNADAGRREVMNAWHRIDPKTREALRRCHLLDLIEGYEKSIRAFIEEEDGNGDAEALVLSVQNPFLRLLLHGVCEFYNLASVTEEHMEGSQMQKMTKIMKKKPGSAELPSITLSGFLGMSKEGVW